MHETLKISKKTNKIYKKYCKNKYSMCGCPEQTYNKTDLWKKVEDAYVPIFLA